MLVTTEVLKIKLFYYIKIYYNYWMTSNEKSTYKADANSKKQMVLWRAAVRGLSTASTPRLFISDSVSCTSKTFFILKRTEKKCPIATNLPWTTASRARLTHGGAPVSAQLWDKARRPI